MQRIKKLKDNNILVKHVGVIDYRKLGYDVHAVIFVRVKKGELHNPDALRELELIPQVESLFAITGMNDVLMIIRARNRAEMVDVMQKVQKHKSVIRTTTHLVLHNYKSIYDFNPLELQK